MNAYSEPSDSKSDKSIQVATCSKFDIQQEDDCTNSNNIQSKDSTASQNTVDTPKAISVEHDIINEMLIQSNSKISKRKRKISYAERARKRKLKMKELRKSEIYADNEKANEKAKIKIRKNTMCQEKIKIVNKLNMPKSKRNEWCNKKEKLGNQQNMKELTKMEKCIRKKISMKKLRENIDYREKERKKDKEHKKRLRNDACYREKEKTSNKEVMKKLREDEIYREKEKTSNKEFKKNLREDECYREKEKKSNKEIMKNLREDESYKEKERTSNKEIMNKLRKNESYKEKERTSNKEIMRKLREDKSYRQKESCIDRTTKDLQRKNDIIHFRHNLYNKLMQQDFSISSAKLAFIKSRNDLPEFICCCCEGLFFKHSVSNINFKSIESKMEQDAFSELYKSIHNYSSTFVCMTCKTYISKLKIPRLATSNGLKFVDIPESISNLSPLEERMCCPYIPFMQMRPLKSFTVNSQLGVKGSIVNIPIDVNECLQVLPRKFDESATIQVQLKRHIKHKSHYMFETIRPAVVCDALTYLKETPLYINNKIEIDPQFLNQYDKQYSEKIEFVVDEKDKHVTSLDGTSEDLSGVESDSDEEDWEEVLLVDRNNANHNNKIHVIAPGQSQTPVAWHTIQNIDELCFPKIFCGHPLDTPDFISYSDRAKSECRRADRRSCVPSRLLYMAKQKIEKQCTSNINVCLRKTTKTSNIKAHNILNQDFVDNLIKVDSGYQFTKQIRSSPAYWEKKKKDLLATIRQLGKPTFFLTLSAAENWWPELLAALVHLNLKRKITLSDALQMDHFEKSNLVKNDPVTCARYFNQKISNFMKLIKSHNGVFEEHTVEDSYQRVEFQMRGSPHEHMFLWLKDAPVYDTSDSQSLQNVISFIDRFITCENDEKDPYVSLQMHRHTHTCYKDKKNKKKCRFHFPIPPMPRTEILTPLPEEENSEEVKDNLRKINNMTEHFYRNRVNMTFEVLLQKLNITEEDYLLAIRSSVDQARVFLKRSSLEVGINCYNKDILHLFESNMDIQLVLEEYGLAQYIINYVSKVESGLSNLLRNASTEVESGNNDLKEKLRKIANVFLNSNLMSSQEAVYYLLSLPVSKSSRQVIFINTGPRQERVSMLKSKKILQQLPPDSEDVYMEDIIQKYCKRPKFLENICLAEFVAYHYRNVNKNYDEEDDDREEKSPEKVSKAKIIRYRRYKLAQDAPNFYREQVLLLLPFRNEIRDVESKDCQELYTRNLRIIEANGAKFSMTSEDPLEEALETVQQNNWSGEEEGDDEDLNGPEIADYKVDIFQQCGMDADNKNNSKRYSIPKRVSSEKLLEMLNLLNKGQSEFVKHVVNNFKSNQFPFRIFLSGSAGVGKSTVVNALYQAVTHYFDNLPGEEKDKIVVLLCAPSGKAAFLIRGVTLHTAFALPVAQFSGNMPELSSDIANNIREKLFHLKLLIIDEISMVGSRLLSRVDTRLRQIMGRSDPFGGVSVIAVGDLHQLPPVMDSPVYKFVPNEFSSLLDRNPLWDAFQFYELTQVMRQKEELRFIEVLNNLASGLTTTDDINLLNTRVVKPANVPVTAVRLFSTNKDVEEYNEMRINQHKGKCYLSEAQDFISGKPADSTKSSIVNSLRKKKISEVNGLPHSIQLKVGIKYMLTSNIDVEDGLVNGACGILKKIIFKPNTENPQRLFFDFNDESVGSNARLRNRPFMESQNINLNLTPIDLSRNLLNISNKLNFEVTRVQFPVICAEAITIHKSQGQTYNEVCLDFDKSKRISRSMLYVALSRVTKLSGLYLLSQFKELESSKGADVVLEEMNRLRKEKSITILK